MATNLVLEFEFAKRNRVFESILFGKLRHFYSVSWGVSIRRSTTDISLMPLVISLRQYVLLRMLTIKSSIKFCGPKPKDVPVATLLRIPQGWVISLLVRFTPCS